MEALGYGLILDHDVESGESIVPENTYYYQIEHGPVIATGREMAGIRLRGATLQSLARDEFEDQLCIKEAKRLMRTVLNYYLGDKPLHSRELYLQMAHHASHIAK